MLETKVVRVNHGKVFSDRDWFTFHRKSTPGWV